MKHNDDAAAAELAQRAASLREQDEQFAYWAGGYGPVAHTDRTQVAMHALVADLCERRRVGDPGFAFRILAAADRITSAAMWLVVHMTYARRVYPDGRPLTAGDCKTRPEGHTGGSLNMVPAYVGYLAANSLSGITRGWLMGQGHCVSAIDATNLIVANLLPAHAERYDTSAEGLSRFVGDFYAYTVSPDGRAASPLGSHVNAHTAGGLMEGGYLGFAELQYMHMPLPGERLVTFLSDGAFEEQRGSDWTPRWWRAGDCGLVTPFMIMNGRRIDQRSSMAMKGGADWLTDHLAINGFDPLSIDGRDPASFAWGIIEMESRLENRAQAIAAGDAGYPVQIPYGIAETIKGYGFPGAGTRNAHNLPLRGNPAEDRDALDAFNNGVAALYVPTAELHDAARMLNQHARQDRPKERDHPLVDRQPPAPERPTPPWREGTDETPASPMEAIDTYFCALVEANPGLRVRVGNPDEMRSNRLTRTLALLRHRVGSPEPDADEDVHGAVVSALNEEAVVNAALANKGGINLVASYEAFAVKMLGAIRQELIFARHLAEAGRPPGWLAVPVIATSHTWENAKNEQSHQDPTFAEALLGEMGDVSRVLFPGDWNSALAALRAAYAARGQIWTMVVPKAKLPVRFTRHQAGRLTEAGALRLRGASAADEPLQLVAIGAYQLDEVLKASRRLDRAAIEHSVVYVQEPGRLRVARDEREAAIGTPSDDIEELFPRTGQVRVVLTHTRPEPMAGILWHLLTDPVQTPVLGYVNRGGTLDRDGMLFANRCSWAHVLAAAASGLGESPDALLNASEYAAISGQGDPSVVMNPRVDEFQT